MRKIGTAIAPVMLSAAGALGTSAVHAEGLIESIIEKTTFLGQFRVDAAFKTNDE